jgi:hypothetical protein
VRIRIFRYECARKGSGRPHPPWTAGWPRVRPGPPRGLVRLQPETWTLLASLRRPLVDSEGNLVGLESFDRLVRRILAERKNAQKPAALPREATR